MAIPHLSQVSISTPAGTPPLVVTSSDLVSNLNAQYLNGQLGSYYAAASSLASYLPLAGGTLTGDLTISGASRVFVGSYMNIASSVGIPGMIGLNRNVTTGAIFNASYGAYQIHNNAGLLEIQTYTGAGAYVGAHTFNNSGNVAFITGTVTAGGNQVLHAGNYTSYPPARWATGRTISLTGDVTGTSVAFDGTAALSFAATLANSGATAGTYTKVTVNAKGLITAGTSLTSADLPTYTGTITSGQVTTGLGFTPYNASNPSNYITSSGSITGNAATATNGFTFKPGWAGNQNLIAATGNLNSSVPSGFYEAFQATNSPTPTTWCNLINVRHSNTGNDHGFQLAMGYYDETLWSRTYQGGTGANNGNFTTWRAHLHSGNYSSYALPLSGGTLTGGITATNFTGPGTGLTGNATSLTAGAVPWSGITSKPTTLSGFGITDAASINGASNQNFSANAIYPYEWIRFMSASGIYWQSGSYAGWHIHPQALWGMSFRSASTDCGLQLRRSNDVLLGSVYSDGTSIGFLDASNGWGASFTIAGAMNRGSVPGSLVTGNISGSAGSVAWSGITSKPTTLAGYALTDVAYGQAAYQSKSLDTVSTPGLYQYDGAFGGTKPPDNGANYRTVEIGSGSRFSQIAMPWNSENIYFRRITDSTYSAWRTVIHDGNYTSYPDATKLPLTGGAITGNSTFSADNYLTFGPNSSWSRSLRIGGNGYTAPVTTTASVVTTDGNLHLDAAKAAKGIYLNWYGGTSGTIFGNGSGTQVGVVDGSGNASFIGSLDMTVGPVNAKGELRTLSQVRATGWYNDPTGTSYTGLATELGVSGGQGYILCYNRNAGAYGVLNIAGSASNLQISGGTVNVSAGALQQGGNQVLHAGNYTSYTLPRGGGWYGASLPGTRWGGFSANGGEIVFGQDLPAAGQMGILIDGCYIAAENNGFWSLANSNDWTTRRGMYFDGTYLRFDYNSATAYFHNASIGGSQVLHAGNYTAYPDATKLPLAGGTLTGQVQLKAGHGDTRFQLYYNYANDTNHAYAGFLTLWSSEPGITHPNGGIGANINMGGQYYGRAGSGNAYGVYLRFDVVYGRTEFYNTTGVPGTAGGQGTLRAKIESDGEIYATASQYKVLHAGNYGGYSTFTGTGTFVGSVGIGTTGPSAKLHVYNGSSHFEATSNGNATITAGVYALVIGPLSNRDATAGRYYGGVAFNHLLNYNGNSAYNGAPQAWIGTRLQDTAGSERDYLVFATKPGTGTSGTGSDIPQERMCIDRDGLVGIGTLTPGAKLHVYSSAAVDTLLESGTSGTTGKLIFKTSDNADLNKYIMQESFYMVLNGHANEGFKFRDSNGNVLLSIFGAQNAYASRVGIGTITPAYKLDVNGTGRFSGDLTVTGALNGTTASFSGAINGTELTLTGTGIGAYNHLKYGGLRTSGNWQTFTNTEGQINIIEVHNITGGGYTNNPTGVYTYGAVMSWRTNSHSFQLYAAHTGDLAYKTQWGNDNYSGWRRILDSTNYPYAAAMNQNVGTSNSPTFASLLITSEIVIQKDNPRNLAIQGSGGADCGLLGRGSSGQFAFQVYGSGGNYGFLNAAWGGWDLQKTVSGNLYLNANGTYYLNPASLTNLLSLTVANTISGSITGNAAGSSASCTGNAASATYARRLEDASRTSFTVGGNKDNYYPVIFNIGSGPTTLQYSEFVIERGGYEEPGYTFAGGNTFSTLNIRFSCKSSGWGYGATYENVEMHGYTTQLVANWQQMSEASKLIVWLRGATIYYFWNVVANTTLHDGNSGGTSLTLASAPYYSYTYTSTQTVQTKALYGKYVNSSTGTSGIYVAGNVLAEGLFSGPGTGLTGTASSLVAGSANAIADGAVSTSAKIAASVVTYAKIQNVTAYTVLGNSSASGVQAPVEISMATLAGMVSSQYTTNIGNTYPDRVFMSTDANIKYAPIGTAKAHLGITSKYGNSRPSITGDTSYWTGAMGWGATDWNSVFDWGSGFTDSWSSPANNPGDTSHHLGIQSVHYTNGSARYGWQMVNGVATGRWWLRDVWGGGFSSWKEVIHSGNIASQTVAVAGSCTGSAGSVAWTNVSGRPTAVSSFSNDSGYITSGGSISGSSGSCSGNAASVTDGVYLSTNQSIGGVKTFSSPPVATNIAKAWVHYNKSTTTIAASYNVSSVTSNGTGVFTVNFTNAMVDTNYVVTGTATYGYDDQDIYGMALIVPRRSTAQQTGSCRLATEFLHAAQIYDCVAVRAVFYR